MFVFGSSGLYVNVKSRVALTALPEPALRELLRAGAQRLPEPAQLSVAQVPAEFKDLPSRPTLFKAIVDIGKARS